MAQDNAELPPPHCSQEVAQLRQELAQSQEREAELKERVDYLNALVAPTEQHRRELKALVLAAQQALVDAGAPTKRKHEKGAYVLRKKAPCRCS
jgi:chromosome segregation ATPase